jgi:hypothetical protein
VVRIVMCSCSGGMIRGGGGEMDKNMRERQRHAKERVSMSVQIPGQI